jgi:hypothetical protein
MKLAVTSLCLSAGVVGAIWAGQGDDFVSLLHRELDLGMELVGRTNAAFDKALIGLIPGGVVSELDIRQMTFVFYYPKIDNVLPSDTEMSVGLRLVAHNGTVERSSTTNEFPINQVRVFDSKGTNLVCEVELLGSVTFEGNSRSQLIGRMLFRYSFEGSWKEREGDRRFLGRQ